MIDYKTVFQLAQEKGYVRYFQGDTVKMLHSDFIELTLIWKWLRDEKGIFIEIHHLVPTSYNFYFRACSEKGKDIKNARIEGRTIWDTYEQALLEGTAEALKLI
jgi:hypothetical protein